MPGEIPLTFLNFSLERPKVSSSRKMCRICWFFVSHKMAEIPVVVFLVLKKNLAKMAMPTSLDKAAPNTGKSYVPGAQDPVFSVAFLVHPGSWLIIAPTPNSGPSAPSVHLTNQSINTRENSLLNRGSQPSLNTAS